MKKLPLLLLLFLPFAASSQVTTRASLTFKAGNEFYSTLNDSFYSDSAAAANPSVIDFTWFYSNSISYNNFASPLARNDGSIYAAFTINWGVVSTSFRTTALSASGFDTVSAATSIVNFYNNGTPTQVPTNTPGTRVSEVSGELTVGKVIAFYDRVGSNYRYGLIRVNQEGTDSVNISMKFADVSAPTGIAEAGHLAQARLFPNPARETLSLSLPAELNTQDVNARILNLVGSPVDGWLKAETQPGTLSFDVQNLPSGLYFLEAVSGESRIALRFVKE